MISNWRYTYFPAGPVIKEVVLGFFLSFGVNMKTFDKKKKEKKGVTCFKRGKGVIKSKIIFGLGAL